MEDIYYVVAIICSIATTLGVCVSLWQYIFMRKQSKIQRERELELREKEVFEMQKDRIQKAIDLSGYYKDNIIDKSPLLIQIYKHTGIMEIIDKIPREKMYNFDYQEMKQLISKEDINSIKNISETEKFKNVMLSWYMIADFGNAVPQLSTLPDVEDISKYEKELSRIYEEQLRYKYNIMLQEVLNNLEYFALHFTHETADNSVVYQSLHKNYIKLVEIFYYDICNNNKPGETRLYTNVIKLYNMWKEEHKKQQEKELSAMRNNIVNGSSLNVTRNN